MEITALPRRSSRLRTVRVVLAAGMLLVVVLLIPPALGCRAHIVDDGARTGSHARGSLVFVERVPPRQLEVGDVPPADGDLERVGFSVPWVGYPVIVLSSLVIVPWTPAVLGLGLVVVLAMRRRG